MFISRTHFGEIAPRISGSISCFSSALIIHVIMSSPAKLSSTMHRIMFGMSICDILGSAAMALSHLPMPNKSNIIWQWTPYDQFMGTKIGNTQTCTAQGFFVSFGVVATCGYNTMLCVYYCCSIAFNINEQKIKNIYEPVFHLFPILVSLSAALPPIFYNLYNPTPWEAWCSVDPLPYNCYSYCRRGSLELKKVNSILPAALVIFDFTVITISLSIVCLKVDTVQRQMNQLVNDDRRRRRRRQRVHAIDVLQVQPNVERLQERHQLTKIVLVQALLYITAQLLTLAFPLWILLGSSSNLNVALRLIFQPLQGFFNMCIYISFKAFHMIRTNPNLSFVGAVKHLIFHRCVSCVDRTNPPSQDTAELNDHETGTAGGISVVISNNSLRGFNLDDEFISLDEYMEYFEAEEDLGENDSHSSNSNDPIDGDDLSSSHEELGDVLELRSDDFPDSPIRIDR